MDQRALKELLFEALEQPPHQREAFIVSRCGDDTGSFLRVTDLLRAHERAEGHFERQERVVPDTPARQPREIAGRRIVRVLGEGGFGLVYLAAESEPIEREVALKVIRPGHASGDVLARFEGERRVLGLMNHPSIAQVYEAGTTEEGAPYVVMEYVAGVPITVYCRRENLGLRERITLMERTCLAIHHAHQKGVIHRDVKPSNVLVTESDAGPMPKVIDFGIAKALEQTSLATHALAPDLTRTRQVIGTPQYMPPEQASGGAGGIDTRADVYALGVLLYECLAGAPPFDPARLARASMGELERIIREEEPPRPSVRVGKLGETEEYAKRSRQLRGELDWIVGRAMEKDPARRYPSAAAMAADLKRWLEGRAVEAGPVSGLYRVKKVISRRRLEFSGGLLILLLILSGSVVSLVYASRANDARLLAVEGERATKRELAKYEQITDFTQSMFEGIDPSFARGTDTALLAKILEDAKTNLESKPPEDPEVSGTLRLMIGLAYRSIGDYDNALPLLEQADAGMGRALGPTAPRAMEAQNALAVVLAETGRFHAALPVLERVHRNREAAFGSTDDRTLESLGNVGTVRGSLGLYESAAEAHRAVYEARRQKNGDDDAATVFSLNNLAMAYQGMGRHQEALEMLDRVIEVQGRLLGSDSPRLLATRNNRAGILNTLHRIDEAIREYEEVLEAKRRVLPRAHPSLLSTMSNLAGLYKRSGDLDLAMPLYEDALRRAREGLPEADVRTATIAMNYAEALRDGDRLQEALPLFEEAEAVVRLSLGADHPKALIARVQHAAAIGAAGDTTSATERLDELLPVARTQVRDDGSFMLTLLDAAAEIRELGGELEAAISLLEERYARAVEFTGADGKSARSSAERLARLSAALGRVEEQRIWSERALGLEPVSGGGS